MSLKLNSKYLSTFISEEDLLAIEPEVRNAHGLLNENSAQAKGNDFHGWLRLPIDYDKEEFARIKKSAAKIISDSDVLVVIGIGGSYLGARAAIEFVKSKNYNIVTKDNPKIFFLGNSISPTEINEIYSICENCDFSVNVISKSGTTTEPAIAFRVFKTLLEKKYGEKEAAERIYVTTDKAKGTLKSLADRKCYEEFVVPDDVGGRFSVLTAVGLLPIACAGIDIETMQLTLGKEAVTYLYNPYDAPGFQGGLSCNFGGTVFQNPPNSRSDILSIYTEPFAKDTFVKGKMSASLRVASDCEDTGFYVRISLEKEQGDYGLRDDITSLVYQLGDYTPGSQVDLKFTFDEHAFLIQKGERLRIDIASADDEHYVNHTNQKGLYSEQTMAKVARNTVYLQESKLMLPVEQTERE